MLETIEGIYENGQIQIDRPPHNSGNKTQVLVTFLDPNNIDPAKLSELIARIETIAGISQGLEELNQGQTRPIGDFIQDMQRKYDIPG
jgi:glutamate mutase epsilon subunit